MEENIPHFGTLSNSDLKSKLPLVSAVLLLLVLVGAAGFLLGKSLSQPKTSPPPISQVSPRPTPTPTPEIPISTPIPNLTTESTDHWRVYVSNKYRYSIKYPPSWSLILEESGGEEYVTVESLKGISKLQATNPAEYETNGFFNIIVEENPNNLSLKDWFDTNENCEQCAPSPPKFSHLSTINGKETLIANQSLPGPLGEAIKIYYFAHNKKIYKFLFFFPEEETSKQLFENIYNQVLSTFKFLE